MNARSLLGIALIVRLNLQSIIPIITLHIQGGLNIYGTHVTDNNSINNKCFFFGFRFENSQLLILNHNCLRLERKDLTSLLIWRQNHLKLSENRCNSLI